MVKFQLLLVLVGAVLIASLVAAARPAQATFPGANGKIAFDTSGGGAGPDAQIYTVNPEAPGRRS